MIYLFIYVPCLSCILLLTVWVKYFWQMLEMYKWCKSVGMVWNPWDALAWNKLSCVFCGIVNLCQRQKLMVKEVATWKGRAICQPCVAVRGYAFAELHYFISRICSMTRFGWFIVSCVSEMSHVLKWSIMNIMNSYDILYLSLKTSRRGRKRMHSARARSSERFVW